MKKLDFRTINLEQLKIGETIQIKSRVENR